ncbi:MAG: STAS domain-containing protein [Candidatus Cloacimonadales bacterium]|jgi:anti-sigma B factor antagonist|nr:STAS domain-containing protein [Candidatus Cloacimonadota bacterium]MDD2651310.1 STAS domain-containing protein [Candidatus Cloacimonadota bacterium]MDD3501180.1 STAS domain-containing protein [Candidatus Cloacimonadota bacterium]MDX9977754.1 STAS domain-containing protein [Candidatus Cloacimonadales bacterium]
MDITIDIEGKTALMKVNGVISSDNAYLFQEKLNEVLDSKATKLEMDLSGCRNMSSIGIGKLLIFYKDFMNREGEVDIIKSSPAVYDLFTTIKLNQLISISL